MPETYFHRLHASTETRLWINNPTPDEARRAIAQGAVACTTNPTYGAKMLKADPGTVETMVDEALEPDLGDAEVAHRVAARLTKRVMEVFRPVHEASGGTLGWVSIQGNPFMEHDTDHILREAREYRDLGPNFIAKIPATHSGLRAIEVLVGEGFPVIVTEIFALAQAVAACELYRRVSEATGQRPAYYVTHISGIFDEHLKKVAERDGIRIDPGLLDQAGCMVARKQYRLLKERGYPGVMLGGGARGLHHFTGLTGGDMHITINPDTADEIDALDPPVEDSIHAKPDPAAVAELCDKLDVFRQAWEEDGLAEEAFSDYGPVQHFLDAFKRGWTALEACVASRRALLVG